MTHSFAQQVSLSCPRCGRNFDAELWLIIDTAERPDLLERIRNGTLHDVTCPHCGHSGQVDAPLLILTPPPAPSPLLTESQERGGGGAAGAGGGVRPLLPLLQSFINARTWAESRRIVEQHPELLGDDADALLGGLLDTARGQGDEDAARVLEEHRALLRRCREAGIPRAFAEKMLSPEALAAAEAAGLTPEQALEIVHLVAEMPSELLEALAELAASGAEIRSPEDLERLLSEHPDLRQKLEEAARRAAGGEGPSIPSQFRADLRRAQEGLARYEQTGSVDGLNAAVAAWERILNHPAFAAADPRFQLAAMNDAGGAFLRRYWARGQLSDLNRALVLWQQAVSRTPPDSPDLPAILNNLGTGLRDRYARTGRLEDLEEAIRVYQQAVSRTPPDSPDLPSRLNNLGNGLRARYARTGRSEDLEEAIRVWRQAVEPLRRRTRPTCRCTSTTWASG